MKQYILHASRTIQMCEDYEVILSHFPISSGCTMPLPRKVWNTFALGLSSHVMATTLLAASKCIQMSKKEATKWQHNEQKESENGSMHSSGSASPAPSWSRCYIGQNDFSAGGLPHPNLVLPSFAWSGSALSWAKLNLPVYCFDIDKSSKTHR